MNGRAPLILLWGGCILFFLLFAINLFQHPLSASTTVIDEQAHISYAMHLITQHRWWPDFNDFHMVEADTLQPLHAVNYLNHPPVFYWPMKLIASITDISASYFRVFAITLYAVAMLLYTRIGVKLQLPLAGCAIYAAFPFLINLMPQTGFYNNDAAGMLGGMLATYASIDWCANNHPRHAFWLMVLGVALASVKLTSFLLVGSFVLACFAFSRHRIPARDWLFAACTGILLLIPYAMMFHLTGHLAPDTIGQLNLMQHPPGTDWVRTPYNGWVQQPPMDFMAWFGTFLINFADQSAGLELLFLPLLLLIFAFGRTVRYRTSPMGLACLAATLLVLTVHSIHSWHRYRTYGWLVDSLIRYYFPLLGAYGAVCAEAVKRRQA